MGEIGLFYLGFVLLLFGADSLLRGAAGVARGAGLSASNTGLLLIGLVAASPQLAVTAYAIAHGSLPLALGHAIGGSLGSLGLALGVAALVSPLVSGMRVLAMQSLAVVAGAALVLVLGLDGKFNAFDGALLLALFFAWIVMLLRSGAKESAAVQAELADSAETSTNAVQNFIRLLLAGALLYFGSRWVVLGAPAAGAMMGLNAFTTGMTLLAAGTALPGLLMASMAAAQGQGNVAIAQILGACACNLLLSVGALALAGPVPAPGWIPFVALPATLVIALLLHFLLRKGLRIGRREGALLVAAFLAWIGAVFAAVS